MKKIVMTLVFLALVGGVEAKNATDNLTFEEKYTCCTCVMPNIQTYDESKAENKDSKETLLSFLKKKCSDKCDSSILTDPEFSDFTPLCSDYGAN